MHLNFHLCQQQHHSKAVYSRVSICMQNICMHSDTLTFSKTQLSKQIEYSKIPWNIYVKTTPTEEFIIGDE